MLRGRVKWFAVDKGYGWLETDNGGLDHFIHINQRRRVLIDVNGIAFGTAPMEGDRIPKEGDAIIFESGMLPGKSQPQAMPWAFASELEVPFRRVSQVFIDGMRLLGLA
jgi:hypothetical protein